LAVVVGIALVALFTTIFGNDDTTKAAAVAPVSAIVTTTTATTTAASATTAAPTSTTLPTTTTIPPTTTTLAPVTQNHVFVMGDSVMLGAADEIPAALPGWNVIVDAKVSRFLNQGIEVLQARRAEVGAGGVVVIQQGNNYLGSEQQFREEIDQTMAVLSGVPKVVWITVSEFTQSRVDVNREILAAAQRYPNIVLADWNGIWLANRAFTSHDGLHLKPAGQAAFAAMVAQVVGAPPAP
jgi:lysophospholipase L1-like esterase